jgi:ABC-2 type transport system permease protein
MVLDVLRKKIGRIMALIFYDLSITFNSKWQLVETFYYPFTTLIIWGLFAKYVGGLGGTGNFAVQAAYAILIVQIYWSFASLSQSAITSTMMEDIWSGGIRELLITPLKPHEFIIARCFTAVWRSTIVFVLLMIGGYYFFGISFFFTQLNFVIALALLSITVSIGLGILISALVIHLGVGYGFLSFSLLSLFMMLSAPFYPASIFPEPLLSLSKAMPYTWIFESIRHFVSLGTIDYSMILYASLTSAFYFIIAFPMFSLVFKKAKEKGRLVKLWE